MKLEINFMKKNGQSTKMWILNNMLPRNQWVNEEMKEEIITSLKTNTNDNTTLQNLWDTAKLTLRDNFINKTVPQKSRKNSNIQFNLMSGGIR